MIELVTIIVSINLVRLGHATMTDLRILQQGTVVHDCTTP
jgi:hypothetical protein